MPLWAYTVSRSLEPLLLWLNRILPSLGLGAFFAHWCLEEMSSFLKSVPLHHRQQAKLEGRDRPQLSLVSCSSSGFSLGRDLTRLKVQPSYWTQNSPLILWSSTSLLHVPFSFAGLIFPIVERFASEEVSVTSVSAKSFDISLLKLVYFLEGPSRSGSGIWREDLVSCNLFMIIMQAFSALSCISWMALKVELLLMNLSNRALTVFVSPVDKRSSFFWENLSSELKLAYKFYTLNGMRAFPLAMGFSRPAAL